VIACMVVGVGFSGKGAPKYGGFAVGEAVWGEFFGMGEGKIKQNNGGE